MTTAGGAARRLVVEADGGARGNPGPAAYGAVVRDADTQEVLAEAAEAIGDATNNVAEYRGLLAGLRLAREVDPAAALEVRMDSKLVVEQMAGRWKIKHADMRRLALEARGLVPPGTVWTWVPREENRHADALLNEVLDGGPPVWFLVGEASGETESAQDAEEPSPAVPTTTLLTGPDGAEAAAATLAARGSVVAVVSAPGQECRAAAEVVGKVLDLPVAGERDLAAPVASRVRSALERVLRTYAGQSVVVVTSAPTVRLLVCLALGVKPATASRMELPPGSVSELAWYPDGSGVLRSFGVP